MLGNRRIFDGSVALVLLTLAAPSPAPAQLVVNEIDYNQPGVDTAEFIELLNVSAETVNLDSYEVRLVNGATGGTLYGTIDLPAINLAPGDYYVICGNPGTVINCDQDGGADNDLIQNGSPDAVAVAVGAMGPVIDTVSYEGDTGMGYTETSGVGLEDTGVSNHVGISRFPDGADTGVNNVDLSPRCITPGMPNTSNTTDCPMPTTGVAGDQGATRLELPSIVVAPNPFHPSVEINFTVPWRTQVNLVLVDASGRAVRRLVDEPMEAGTYRRLWDGRDDRGRALPSGVYFCRLSTPTSSAVEKLILVH